MTGIKGQMHQWPIFEDTLLLLLVLGLIYGNLVYQLTRIGYFRRLQVHAPLARHRQVQEEVLPSLTVLIPSYKEEREVVYRTMLSAALQEYPDKRIVLCIDNPPDPTDEGDRALLQSVRQLCAEIQKLMDGPEKRLARLLRLYEERMASGARKINMRAEVLMLRNTNNAVGKWFRQQAALHSGNTHSDRLFIDQTYIKPSGRYFARARQLDEVLSSGEPLPSTDEILSEYKQLASRFNVTMSSFERKAFINLSHESNKAMNLNSYIGLLGKSLRERRVPGGLFLEPCAPESRDALTIEPADYLITLDADSILSSDYARRLIEFAQQPENRRLAIIQTPYSAEPNPPTTIERIAGATTDMQYIIHQGFTHYGATFWVGANALIRTSALDDICVIEEERGYPIRRYIQDRTVIEDTESSIDLTIRGWKLYNYPERLSYSATPGDYGALLIQRRRWANGGLIILPKLLGYLLNRNFFSRASEGFFRIHYLISIAIVNIAIPILLFYPFEEHIRNIWLPMTCVPYFFLYGRDLLKTGYRLFDLFRVYALNLLLIPINLGGVFKSIQQLLTHEKTPFKRTPKVAGRTAAPKAYLLVTIAFILLLLVSSVIDMLYLRWFHAAFALASALIFIYAFIVFIGPKAFLEDTSCYSYSKVDNKALTRVGSDNNVGYPDPKDLAGHKRATTDGGPHHEKSQAADHLAFQ
ncbi:MAG: glycosyltransferase [Coriobacteriales bacterium]|nr:glycosyltransferase [Coriobacteriales bacterium]